MVHLKCKTKNKIWAPEEWSLWWGKRIQCARLGKTKRHKKAWALCVRGRRPYDRSMSCREQRARWGAKRTERAVGERTQFSIRLLVWGAKRTERMRRDKPKLWETINKTPQGCTRWCELLAPCDGCKTEDCCVIEMWRRESDTLSLSRYYILVSGK